MKYCDLLFKYAIFDGDLMQRYWEKCFQATRFETGESNDFYVLRENREMKESSIIRRVPLLVFSHAHSGWDPK